MTYQIKDWDANFENDRSRRVEKCSFVCVPNKQHGMGFLHVIQEPDGAMIYGIWACLLGACSQQKHRDGWLTSDGEPGGRPWGVADLVVKLHRPKKEIERALEVLCSVEVGWIVCQNVKEGELPVSNPPPPRKERPKFEPPTVDQVREQMAKVGFPVGVCRDKAELFVSHYAARGWKYKGGEQMVSWQHAVTTWKKYEEERNGGNGQPAGNGAETWEEQKKRIIREAQQ